MEIIDLELGQRASDENDRIVLTALPNGKFSYVGSAQLDNGVVFSTPGEMFDSLDGARQEGILWAEEKGVALLYIEYPPAGGALFQPH